MDLPECATCTVPRPTSTSYVEGNLQQLGIRVLLYGHDVAGHAVLAADTAGDPWVEVFVYGPDHQPLACNGHGRTVIVPLPITIERP
jgi:hypothetical protein